MAYLKVQDDLFWFPGTSIYGNKDLIAGGRALPGTIFIKGI